MPTRDDLDHYYGENYTAYNATHGAEASDRLVVNEALAKGEFRHIAIPNSKRVLDFGSGGGYFLRICRKLGADVQGIELSEHGVAITRNQGIPVFQGTIEEFAAASGDQKFDVITSNHVIEHIHDPIAALSVLRSLLAENGLMTITVPNAQSNFQLAVFALLPRQRD